MRITRRAGCERPAIHSGDRRQSADFTGTGRTKEDQERLKRESALVGGVSSAVAEVRETSRLICEPKTMNATDSWPKPDLDTNQVSRSLVGRLPDAVDVEIGEKAIDLSARFPGVISRGKGQS